MISRIMQTEEGVITPSEVCIILHIIRKPNSILIVLLVNQNISKILK